MSENKATSLDDVFSAAMDDKFWAIRGKSIAAYAKVEQSLCWLFALFAGMERENAEIIFFRLNNSRVVQVILATLLKKNHSEIYDLFWRSLANFVSNLVTTRNNLVHWTVSTTVTNDGFAGLSLIPPEFRTKDPKLTSALDTDDLIDFINRCDFVSRLCMMFHAYLDPQTNVHLMPEQRQTWHEVFQQQVSYPPKSNHPLFLKPTAPENQPPPSPA